MRRLRSMRSRWPLCIGIEHPGIDGALGHEVPRRSVGIGRKTRVSLQSGAKESQGGLPEAARLPDDVQDADGVGRRRLGARAGARPRAPAVQHGAAARARRARARRAASRTADRGRRRRTARRAAPARRRRARASARTTRARSREAAGARRCRAARAAPARPARRTPRRARRARAPRSRRRRAPAKRSRKAPPGRYGIRVSRQAMRTWSAVGRRASRPCAASTQPPPLASAPGDDPHAQRSARPASRAIELAAPARRAAPSRSGRGARAGPSCGIGRDDGQRLRRASSRTARVAQQIGHAELGQPRLAGAEELAGPAQLEIHLGDAEAVVGLDHRLDAPRASSTRRPRSAGCSSSSTARGPRGRGAGGAGRGRSAPRARSASREALGTSMPTSMTVVETRTWISPALKSAHDRVLLVEAHAARAAGRPRSSGNTSRCRRSRHLGGGRRSSSSDSSTSG